MPSSRKNPKTKGKDTRTATTQSRASHRHSQSDSSAHHRDEMLAFEFGVQNPEVREKSSLSIQRAPQARGLRAHRPFTLPAKSGPWDYQQIRERQGGSISKRLATCHSPSSHPQGSGERTIGGKRADKKWESHPAIRFEKQKIQGRKRSQQEFWWKKRRNGLGAQVRVFKGTAVDEKWAGSRRGSRTYVSNSQEARKAHQPTWQAIWPSLEVMVRRRRIYADF